MFTSSWSLTAAMHSWSLELPAAAENYTMKAVRLNQNRLNQNRLNQNRLKQSSGLVVGVKDNEQKWTNKFYKAQRRYKFM